MCDSIGSVGEVCAFYQAGTKGGKGQLRCAHASAARGIVESIYYHPGLQWHIKTDLCNESYPFS